MLVRYSPLLAAKVLRDSAKDALLLVLAVLAATCTATATM
jgi:hypothetical protein